MGGLEILALTVVFIVTLVGVARGPARELGVTMALVVLLALLAQLDNLVALGEMPGRVNKIVASVGLDTGNVDKQRMTVLVLFSTAVIMTAFLAYHGRETLKFGFKDPRGVLGILTGGLVGALNGYLMSGTVWYYMHQLEYPIKQYAWFKLPLTEMGQSLVKYLPQNVVSGMMMSGLALVLLWWKILK
jgi:MFS superfamily sulfate permease-like transporter